MAPTCSRPPIPPSTFMPRTVVPNLTAGSSLRLIPLLAEVALQFGGELVASRQLGLAERAHLELLVGRLQLAQHGLVLRVLADELVEPAAGGLGLTGEVAQRERQVG